MARRDGVLHLRLDASDWRNALDFYDAILDALEAPPWHGRSPDALVDSVVWGGMSGLQPPYRIVVAGLANPEHRK